MEFTLRIISVLMAFSYMNCAIYWSPTQTEIVNGKEVRFCKYGDKRLQLGEEYTDYNQCVQCDCGDTQLYCRSIVFRFSVPDDSQCIDAINHCENHWVLRSDTSQPCPPHLLPKVWSAVGK